MSQLLYDQLQVLEPKNGFDDKERLKAMERPLLSWYEAHKRILPWRENPRPYEVWISEIMLQQTRVEAVKPYFERFIKALPTVEDLAASPEDELLKLWEGLGYYNRARNLQKAARIIAEKYGGRVPASFGELEALPGIGSYTAGAIASIAYGIPEPAVDGNVLRVVSRVCASREDIKKQSVKRKTEENLRSVMPSYRAGDYNQSLIELGAIVCVPNGAPLCGECPLASVCKARKEGLTDVIPVKTPKKARRIEEKTVLILTRHGRVAIRKRQDAGLLASLYELPNLEGCLAKGEVLKKLGITAGEVAPLSGTKHIFSHVEWHMTGYRIEIEDMEEQDFLWVTPEEMKKTYSLPGAFKAYTKMIR